MAADKKGITVKVDADLHAEIREYLDAHQMTMAEFISLAVEDELHPKYQEKEENTMEKMRTLAFQVPEDLFQRIKDYLRRNNMTQKEFVIGLIESEIERDLTAREAQDKASQIAEVKEDETLEDEDSIYEEIEDAEEEIEDEVTETEEEAEDEILDENEDELEEEAEDEFLGEDEEIEETDEDAELGEDDADELDDESKYDEDEEETEGMSMGM